jgi:site-specific DNA-methyltransferase (adenine-specific)
MRYLVKLVTPSGGKVIDPFAGSGTTLVAAIEERFDCVGIESDPEYLPILQNRVGNAYEREEERRSQEEAFNMIFELESE